jgi:hypothetical protein
MEKRVSRFLIWGLLVMGLSLLLNRLAVADSWSDFVKGLGAGVTIGAFIIQILYFRKKNRDKEMT